MADSVFEKKPTPEEVFSEFMCEVLAILASKKSSEKKEKELLGTAVSQCRKLMHAQMASIWIADNKKVRLEIKAASGYQRNPSDPEKVKAVRNAHDSNEILPENGVLYYNINLDNQKIDGHAGVTSDIWLNGRTVNNLTKEKEKSRTTTGRIALGLYDKFFYGDLLDEMTPEGKNHPCKQFFGVPIFRDLDKRTYDKNQCFGVLKVENKELQPGEKEEDFTESQQKSMTSIATSLAGALHLIRSAKQSDDGDDNIFRHLIAKTLTSIHEINIAPVDIASIECDDNIKNIMTDMMNELKAIKIIAKDIVQLTMNYKQGGMNNSVNIFNRIMRHAEFFENIAHVKFDIPQKPECMGEFILNELTFETMIFNCFKIVSAEYKKGNCEKITVKTQFDAEKGLYSFKFICPGVFFKLGPDYSNLVDCLERLGKHDLDPFDDSLSCKIDTTQKEQTK